MPPRAGCVRSLIRSVITGIPVCRRLIHSPRPRQPAGRACARREVTGPRSGTAWPAGQGEDGGRARWPLPRPPGCRTCTLQSRSQRGTPQFVEMSASRTLGVKQARDQTEKWATASVDSGSTSAGPVLGTSNREMNKGPEGVRRDLDTGPYPGGQGNRGRHLNLAQPSRAVSFLGRE